MTNIAELKAAEISALREAAGKAVEPDSPPLMVEICPECHGEGGRDVAVWVPAMASWWGYYDAEWEPCRECAGSPFLGLVEAEQLEIWEYEDE